MRKLWCTGAIAGGVLLLGAAPAWADDTPADRDKDLLPAADVLRTVPAAEPPTRAVKGAPVADAPTARVFGGLCPDGGMTTLIYRPVARVHGPDERPIAPRMERRPTAFPYFGGLAGAMPVITHRIVYVGSGFAGMPFGGLPLQPGRSAPLMPDDGVEPIPAPAPSADPIDPATDPGAVIDTAADPTVDPDAVLDPDAIPGPDTVLDPDAVLDPEAPVDPDAVISAPTAAPTAGTASVSAPPPAGTPGVSAPSTSSVPAFGTEQKPRTPALPTIDDPRLLEEPVDGFVNREKWKRRP